MQKLMLLVLVAAIPCALSCNRRVFEEVQNNCDTTITAAVDVPTNKAADILIVVDNSGSMAEEQARLADNFLNTNPAECPLQDLANIDPAFKNPVSDLYTGSGPLAKCGFIQLLAAFESDFHVGVVTTDVGLCDNRLPAQQADAPDQLALRGGVSWGFRPQRGCLQPAGPPGSTDKLLAHDDLTDADAAKHDLAGRFKAILDNTQTWGSPFERGLDAAAIFLQQEPGVDPNPACVGDFDRFRRKDAALVVIFLSDENDCSHGNGDSSFDDELAGETCGQFEDIVTKHSPGDCYSKIDTLSPVQNYKKSLELADPSVKVAVIAGGLGAPGDVTAAGCQINPADGTPEGQCFLSGGLSNFTGAGQPCGPEAAAQHGEPCCTADPGSRQFDLAAAIGRKSTDSICNASFRGTMLDIAAFIAAVDFVELAEPPASPDAIVVQITKAGQTTPGAPLAHIKDTDDCGTTTGWRLENNTRVRLCGAARPGPGDAVNVAAEGAQVSTCGG